jgi:LysR family nitrogen assimilation transcriptional regulator
MDGRLEVRELERFVSIVESGNLRQAAAHLKTGQPALSRLIRKLETDFGTPLLKRHSKGIAPTAAGTTLFGEAQSILRRLNGLSSGLSRRPETDHSGTITIGLPGAISPGLAPRLARALKAYWPDQQIRFQEGRDGEIEQWLANGTVQLVLSYSPQPAPGFDVTEISTDKLVLVLPPNAPDARDDGAIELRQAMAFPLILPGTANPIRRRLTEGALRHGCSVEPKIEVQGLRMALSMVRQGLGFTVAPLAALRDDLIRGEVVAREIKRPTLELKLYLIRRTEDDSLPPLLDADGRNFLSNAARQLTDPSR